MLVKVFLALGCLSTLASARGQDITKRLYSDPPPIATRRRLPAKDKVDMEQKSAEYATTPEAQPFRDIPDRPAGYQGDVIILPNGLIDEHYKEVLREIGFRFDDDSDPSVSKQVKEDSPIVSGLLQQPRSGAQVVPDESFHTNLQRALGLSDSLPSKDNILAAMRDADLPDEVLSTIFSYMVWRGRAAEKYCKGVPIPYTSNMFRGVKWTEFDDNQPMVKQGNVTLSNGNKTAVFKQSRTNGTVRASRWVPRNGYATGTVRFRGGQRDWHKYMDIGVVGKGYTHWDEWMHRSKFGPPGKFGPPDHHRSRPLAWCYGSGGTVFFPEKSETLVGMFNSSSVIRVTLDNGTVTFYKNEKEVYRLVLPKNCGDIALAVSGFNFEVTLD